MECRFEGSGTYLCSNCVTFMHECFTVASYVFCRMKEATVLTRDYTPPCLACQCVVSRLSLYQCVHVSRSTMSTLAFLLCLQEAMKSQPWRKRLKPSTRVRMTSRTQKAKRMHSLEVGGDHAVSAPITFYTMRRDSALCQFQQMRMTGSPCLTLLTNKCRILFNPGSSVHQMNPCTFVLSSSLSTKGTLLVLIRSATTRYS